MGDLMDELREEEWTDEELEDFYQRWQEENANLEPDGLGFAPDGEPVPRWKLS